MKMSEKIDKIMPALLKVKGQMEAVKKDAKNPFFKSKYSGLNNYLEGVEPLLQDNGLVLLQPSTSDIIETIIVHAESGQYVASEIKIPTDIVDPQKLGSFYTYQRRYTLAGLLAFQTEEDNDAEGYIRPENKFLAKPTPSPLPVETTPPVESRRGFAKPKTGGAEWN
jgi:hypothetical protein